ncbi:MAG: hypothetical protein ACO2OZ_13545 [Acidilobaceae archaeon]
MPGLRDLSLNASCYALPASSSTVSSKAILTRFHVLPFIWPNMIGFKLVEPRCY